MSAARSSCRNWFLFAFVIKIVLIFYQTSEVSETSEVFINSDHGLEEMNMSPYQALASPPVLSVSVMTAIAPIPRGSPPNSRR